MTEKISNALNSHIGGAKETIGNITRNPNLAASGAAQKAQADSAQQMATNKIRTEGVGHSVEGEAQQKIGALTGDTAMESRGIGNQALGNVQRNA
ncbi:hypothetical protein BG011_010181 [Mortierella polycephala]|uniref:CsbD-like domain-containing protein n=1 Tax=Mortierella polycephala TaxID=41804 RepID=A0A9P6PMK8_9FUNG|nr:hypothetical protein BG011_010181 [Mortierella polycephala]